MQAAEQVRAPVSAFCTPKPALLLCLCLQTRRELERIRAVLLARSNGEAVGELGSLRVSVQQRVGKSDDCTTARLWESWGPCG
eukprot:scaffold140296_cov19-Tisochrysis_lutea.AAC.3